MALHWAKIDVPRYLEAKRSRKKNRRDLRVAKVVAERLQSRISLYENFGTRSTIVEMLAQCIQVEPKPLHKGSLALNLPQDFSLIDSPERSVAALGMLAKHMLIERIATVFLDHSRIDKYDLSANGLLDVLVDELSIQARRNGRKLRWRGTYPKDSAKRRFVQAMGVIKRLKIVKEYPEPDVAARLVLFDARSKHYVRAIRPREADKKARVTKNFADYVNQCLRHVNRELTAEARGKLCQYVSEILDNAEEHAGMLDWTIQGYLDTHASVPVCEIAIFNFGRPISQTLSELPKDSFTSQQINKYIDSHSQRGFFKKNWRKEDLFSRP